MKQFTKRMASMLLVLAMLLSLFAGMLSVSAVDSKISYSTSKNSGTRGEVCKALPSSATKYYTGSYAYSSLSATSSSNILSSLRSLISSTHKETTSYNDCKNYASKTDCQAGNGKVTLLYCGYQANQNDFSGSAPGWNREHVWPQSLGGFSTSGAGADLHHVRPDDVTTNGQRGNKRYGNVTGGTASNATITGANNALGGYYSSAYYEPIDSAKGDVARICMYMYVRYGGNSGYNCSNITTVFQSTDVLLEWMELDPVDTWEMGRNEVVEDIQGNRNPFIDYPEYAWLLFNKSVPATMVTPSNPNPVSFNVSAVSNNASYGTVSLSGNVITATPKTGYEVSGYEVNPVGAASVARSGNTFTVSNVTADCTITILFAARTAATVYYIFPDEVSCVESTSAYVGDTVTLASVSGTPEGFTFRGWTLSQTEATATKPTYYTSYKLTASSTTFYALFSYTQDGTTYYTFDPSPCDHPETTQVRTEPTCTKDGLLQTVCAECGEVLESTVIEATGHSYVDTVIEPTCTDKGYTLHTCSACGDEYKNNYTAKLGHDWDEGTVTTAPTATTEGVMTYTCTREGCGETQTEAIPALGGEDPAPCYFGGFTDCNAQWYHEAVDFAVDNGLMGGVGEGLFGPTGTMTRAMIVTVLYREADSPAVEEAASFSDVPAGQWYSDAVAWAEDHSVVNGVGEGKFDPMGNVTREQIATILWRYAGSPEAEADLSAFNDAASISDYALNALNWAVSEGILNGDNGNLRPTGNASRAEFACMIMRYLKGSYPCENLTN